MKHEQTYGEMGETLGELSLVGFLSYLVTSFQVASYIGAIQLLRSHSGGEGGSSKCEQKRTGGRGGGPCLVERSQRKIFFID